MLFVLLCLKCFSIVFSTENGVRFHIIEELPVGTLVGNIAVESGLRVNLSESEFSRLRYSFLDQTKMKELFSIHETTGNLLIKKAIDRETECIFLDLCALHFDVAIHSTSPQIFEIYTVEITIEDTNDNAPKFSSNSTTLTIYESTVIGTSLGLDEATDIDSTYRNTIQSYELVPAQNMFGLNATRVLDRFSVKLTILKELDREIRDFYQFELLAKDGGDPIRTGTLNIYIQVADVNDNSPIFEQESYTISVREGISRQTPILTVRAHDIDFDKNAEIIYRFSPKQHDIERISGLFSINEKTGVIYTSGDIVYGKQNVYEIVVEGSDQGSQPRVSQTSVTITILDIINNKPEVVFNFLISANKSYATLSEAADIGTVIAHVIAEDSDSGPNGQVICAIANEYVNLQNIVGRPGYLITVKKEFDREVKQEHYIAVTCSDQGSPKLSASNSFILQILDENDNPPTFKQTTYSALMDENNERGQYCVKVSATDLDVWPNDEIRYFIADDQRNLFSIHPSTGIITANQILDRERQDKYRLMVLAIDGGTPALTGTALVVIVLKDVNDNKPEFDVPYFQFFVMENLKEASVVGTVMAYDLDTGNNKNIEFLLVQNPGENLPFMISPSSGEITATSTFDREKDTSFIFEIVATDQGIPPLSSKVFVRVYITDENDNKPIIIFPNSINNTVSVSNLQVTGSYLTTIQATDIDESGPNNLLQYEIVAGNEDDIFLVSKTSGKIYLKKPLETMSTIVKILTVTVSDNGKPPLSANQTFSLVLKNVNSTGMPSFVPENSGHKNVIILIAVVSMTVIISGALVAVICILRRSEKIRQKLIEEHEKKKYCVPSKIFTEPDHKVQNEINLKENMPYPEPPSDKGKEIHSSYDDDLDNMELYNSFGTSVFTDTLPGMEKPGQSMKDQNNFKRSSVKHVLSDEQISGIHSLDNISEICGEGTSNNSDSGRGNSDSDMTRSTEGYYIGKSIHGLKPDLKERLPVRLPARKMEQYERKYYGFVDQPAIPNRYHSDLKVVRFNEVGQFCIETSSFV